MVRPVKLFGLLSELGYGVSDTATDAKHVGGRRIIFLGDQVDRGPASPAVLRLVIGMERYAKPTRECRPFGPARTIGAGQRPATTEGSLHNANFRIKHTVFSGDAAVERDGIRVQSNIGCRPA